MTELTLYQTIHLARGRARNLAAHAALLDAAARDIFARPYRPDLGLLAARIAAVAEAEHYPGGLSAFVRIEVTADGEERLLPAGGSLYDGYALRSLTPDAVTADYELPLTQAPSTVRKAAALLARQKALQAGATVAVQCDRNGMLCAADDAPLFGILGKRVLPGPAFPCIERDLVLRALPAAGLTTGSEPLTRELLPRLDELFYADHRGITSLAHCDSLPLMSLLAERIARAMEGLFSEK